MFLSNVTLLRLSVFSLTHAPFLVGSAGNIRGKVNLLHIRGGQFFSHFAYLTSGLRACLISGALFQNFLNSPIAVSSLELIGIQHSKSQVITSSFTCRNAVFSNNTTPDVGAAIRVETYNTIIGNISGCSFTGNSAAFGGAVFFSSHDGLLEVFDSSFAWNDAMGGAHLLLSLQRFDAFDCRFAFGSGLSCVEMNTFTDITFSACSFFRNPGKIFVCGSTGTPVTFNECCFMDYNDTDDFPSNYGMFDDNLFMLFTGTNYINRKPVSPGSYSVPQLLSTITHVEEDTGAAADRCRLVPTPSVTLVVRYSAPAIALTVAMVFFAVVSIAGMLMVVFCHASDIDQSMIMENETATSSGGHTRTP